jgi:hypothetical protein
MLGNLVSRVAAPSSGAGEIRQAGQTNRAMMVIPAGVEERAPANVAQRMRNEPDPRPTRPAQVLGISAVDSAAASTATGRIKPINQPIKTIRQSYV